MAFLLAGLAFHVETGWKPQYAAAVVFAGRGQKEEWRHICCLGNGQNKHDVFWSAYFNGTPQKRPRVTSWRCSRTSTAVSITDAL
jgi:hypothetical protein